MVARINLYLQHMDEEKALIYGKIPENVFVEQLEGFISNDKQDQVCHLSKDLYALKQAPQKQN